MLGYCYLNNGIAKTTLMPCVSQFLAQFYLFCKEMKILISAFYLFDSKFIKKLQALTFIFVLFDDFFIFFWYLFWGIFHLHILFLACAFLSLSPSAINYSIYDRPLRLNEFLDNFFNLNNLSFLYWSIYKNCLNLRRTIFNFGENYWLDWTRNWFWDYLYSLFQITFFISESFYFALLFPHHIL